MNNSWSMVIDFTIISTLILISTVLKTRIPILNKWIVPTSMIAGFLGLILGPELLGLVHFDIDRLGVLVYHFMAIGFIALSLKERNVENNPGYVNSGILIVTTYLVQGLIGFGLLLLLVATVYDGMFPGVGLLLPLGFGQGPGQAFSLGTQWEDLGVIGGGNLGLTFAGLGFVWATVFGIMFMNYLVRKGKLDPNYKHNKQREHVVEKMEPDEIPLSDAIDKLSYQVALIGVIYLITYLTIKGLSAALSPLGTFGETFAHILMGFHFLIGSLYAILFRGIITKLSARGVKMEHTPNNYLLQRISGFSFDYMIAASISAISIYALKEYALPVLVLSTLGGIATFFWMLWLCPRLFPNDKLANILGFYGMLTGTISTGMALVKAVDPNFQSNSTDNMVMGSATALMFGFPLLLILNIPIVGYVHHQPALYLYTFLLLLVYFIVLVALLLFRTRSKKVNMNDASNLKA